MDGHYFTGVGVPFTYMTDPDLCGEKQKENKQNKAWQGGGGAGGTQAFNSAYLKHVI